jgi:hypothetical protein
MGAPKGKNNFATHQRMLVAANATLVEAELKDIRGRAGVNFGDIDALARYLAKVTGFHRTTLKRNTTYRRLLRDFLARQHGATSLVKLDEASPELLRAMVEERNLTIGNLKNQVKVLKTRLETVEARANRLPAPEETKPSVLANAVAGSSDFQDTAFALLQLIQHLNHTSRAQTIVVDESEGVILDAAIPNPRKRRQMAIGPERTKAFITWFKANRNSL